MRATSAATEATAVAVMAAVATGCSLAPFTVARAAAFDVALAWAPSFWADFARP